ncbi:MAG: HpcH/HpaI aldolase/citrate lyase family protein [Acidimicrobiales bacterium]
MELTRSVPLPLADVAGERPRIRHFSFLSADDEATVFHTPPQAFDRRSPKGELSHALGATLYTPSLHPRLGSRLSRAVHDGVTSTVVDLEDSIGDHEVGDAEANLVEHLGRLVDEPSTALPLIFLRPREPDQIPRLAAMLNGALHLVAGFVLPKFCAANARHWLDAFGGVAATAPLPMYFMPVLEGPELLYRETRLAELLELADVFRVHESDVLAVRVGATDLCGLLGLRRSMDETIYDLAPLRDCLADVVNVLGRPSSGLLVSGPVWEYFDRQERIWKPQLRETLFERHSATGRALRAKLINRHLDGLIAEVMADRANGLLGKTVIHPSHVRAVNALSVVTAEEYQDALSILSLAGNGASASAFGNKMNEPKPHRAWAERILARSRAFGVYADGVSFVELLDV